MAVDHIDQKGKLSWAFGVVFLTIVAGCSIVHLVVWDRSNRAEVNTRSSNWFTLAYHVFLAPSFTYALYRVYVDPVIMVMDYRVAGRPEIPPVRQTFDGGLKWTQFTIWTNTVTCCYFWFATIFDVLIQFELGESWFIPRAMVPAWGIVFPMSFLINLVVSLLMMPAIAEVGEPSEFESILAVRSIFLHNGLVLSTSTEFLLCLPVMYYQDFVVMLIYGCTYVFFSYIVFYRMQVFHYYFLDPRFAYAPVGLIGLLFILVGLFFGGASLTQLAQSYRIPCGIALVLVAACTCKWAAHEPYLHPLWTWHAIAYALGSPPQPSYELASDHQRARVSVWREQQSQGGSRASIGFRDFPMVLEGPPPEGRSSWEALDDGRKPEDNSGVELLPLATEAPQELEGNKAMDKEKEKPEAEILKDNETVV